MFRRPSIEVLQSRDGIQHRRHPVERGQANGGTEGKLPVRIPHLLGGCLCLSLTVVAGKGNQIRNQSCAEAYAQGRVRGLERGRFEQGLPIWPSVEEVTEHASVQLLEWPIELLGRVVQPGQPLAQAAAHLVHARMAAHAGKAKSCGKTVDPLGLMVESLRSCPGVLQ